VAAASSRCPRPASVAPYAAGRPPCPGQARADGDRLGTRPAAGGVGGGGTVVASPASSHNWPLVRAIVFAALLYGIVLSRTRLARSVPIEATGQPPAPSAREPQGMSHPSLLPPSDVAARISSVDFRAVADLSDVTPLAGGAPVLVSVEVTSLDPRVKVLDFQPQRVAVRLDPVVSRSLPVMVDRGAVPDGLVLGEPRLGAAIASVRGASSLVARVHRIAARVTIDPAASTSTATTTSSPSMNVVTSWRRWTSNRSASTSASSSGASWPAGRYRWHPA
jgi:hypothetical protein